MTYLDTSLLVSYYCPEPGSGAAQRAIESADELVTSILGELELVSALSGKVRGREMNAGAATRIYREFRGDLTRGMLAMVEVTPRHYERAAAWLSTWKLRLRASDTLHLAVAAELGAALLTADRDQAAAARELNLAVTLLPSRVTQPGA